MENKSSEIITATATFLDQVTDGQRLWSMASLRRICANSAIERSLGDEIIEDWIEQEKWLKRFVLPGKRQERLRVTTECPSIEDEDVCFLETVLELCGKGAHYAYRTALSMSGLSEENLSQTLVVVQPRKKSPPNFDGPFERSDVRPAPWLLWEGFKIWRVERDSRQVEKFTTMSEDGLSVSKSERCLLDCWLRPTYGVSDDRLISAYTDWWLSETNTSQKQKARNLVKVFKADVDNRIGREKQYTDFLAQIAMELSDLFSDAMGYD